MSDADTSPAPALPKGILLPLAFVNFTIGAGAFLVIALLAPMSQALSLSKAQAGWVMGAYALAYAISSPVFIALTGAWRRRAVILMGLGLFVAASLASAFATSAATLYAARIVAAAGAGMVTPVAAAIAVAISRPETRGAALSFVFVGMTMAQVLGVPGAAFIGYTYGVPAAFIVAAALGALMMIWIALAVPADVQFQPQSLATLGRTLLSPRHLVAVLLTVTIATSGYLGMTFMGPLAEYRLGMGRDGVALILGAGGLGAVVGNLLSGRLVDRLGPSGALILFLTGQALVLPALTLIPFNLPVGMALSFVWSLVGWGFTVPQQARLMAIDPATQGVMLALNAAGIYLGSGIGSAMAGAVYQGWGIEATGVVGGAIAALGIAHLLASDWLIRRKG
ncbi:MAG: MFS transporter [Methylobacteriaceae bacterium]|nr:MFS transporter [Methylobacteriaceae bacterium]